MEIALGCMGMSGAYGKTDDFYGNGHNEILIGKAIADRRDKVKLSVKFGALRGPDGSFGGADTRPVAMKNFLAYSLVRLGTDHIDVYRPARLDPAVPIEETVGALAEMVKAGFIRAIGLSEVGPETLRRAAKVHASPICKSSIRSRAAARKTQSFRYSKSSARARPCTASSPAALLSASPLKPGDGRAHKPRFSGEAGAANVKLVAKQWNITPSQLAIGWVMAKAPTFTPTLGMRTMAQLDEALAAKPLTPEQLAAVEAAVPRDAFAGPRAQMMGSLDSEKR